MRLSDVLIEPRPILRPRARRRLSHDLGEALPAFLIGLASIGVPVALIAWGTW
jgi:hypothetical protein